MKIALLGYGKMGKSIEKLARLKGHEVCLRHSGRKAEAAPSSALEKADVAIEFTAPESAFDNIVMCLDHELPVVSGSTGWLERLPEAVDHCRKVEGAFFYASNFSIGVNIFFALNRFLTGMMAHMEQYRASMEEIHHVHKLDAPSGTAIRLAEELIEAHPVLTHWSSGKAEDRLGLPIYSKREGEVPGTHLVDWESEVDRISIRHEAHSREGFARGALRAAEWLRDKTGYFEMKDMLGF
ncbi:MAG: 4-hydroxy-tetrahydrodipicolinate reductase [Saprospiraceae bacterium]|nr:4-hydroxy-tetrahydrodipicolinate reductase [Saprospiraceae bacterium]